jgi:hypothetical protein
MDYIAVDDFSCFSGSFSVLAIPRRPHRGRFSCGRFSIDAFSMDSFTENLRNDGAPL